jgi:hypothetical protein
MDGRVHLRYQSPIVPAKSSVVHQHSSPTPLILADMAIEYGQNPPALCQSKLTVESEEGETGTPSRLRA